MERDRAKMLNYVNKINALHFEKNILKMNGSLF